MRIKMRNRHDMFSNDLNTRVRVHTGWDKPKCDITPTDHTITRTPKKTESMGI